MIFLNRFFWVYLPALICLFLQAGAYATSMSPVVSISQGGISGQLSNGVNIYLGIPYAKAPVGESRWKAPEAAPTWQGLRDATRKANRCPQANVVFPKVIASENEDCLFLNVYVPAKPSMGPRPVMVWIHGGYYFNGAGSDYDMQVMARKGQVVIVTLNYRLGVFGFFNHPQLQDQGSAVNFGLMDQQAALRWVQSEIGRFGGDPNNVTLFGHSAGGASVCMHLVAPRSKGLFHRAILQSGPCGLLASPSANSMASEAIELGKKLSCPRGPNQLECMRKISAATLVSENNVGHPFKDTPVKWGPTPDGVSLLEDPRQSIQTGKFARVPTLIGSTHDEGRLFVAADYHLVHFRPVTEQQLVDAIKRLAKDDQAFEQQLSSIYKVRNYGTRDKALGALITDRWFACDVLEDAKGFARFVPTFAYKFNQKFTPVAFDPFMWFLGAFHGSELPYLLQTQVPNTVLKLPLVGDRGRFADQMITYWVNFARTGNPNEPIAGASSPHWPMFKMQGNDILSPQSASYKTLSAEYFANDHHCDLWRP